MTSLQREEAGESPARSRHCERLSIEENSIGICKSDPRCNLS